MIALSTRYAIPLLLLLLVAGIPVGYHVTASSSSDDCANPAGLYSADRIAGTIAVNERLRDHRMGVFQWTEGQFAREQHSHANPGFRIIRAFEFGEFFFEPKRFFIGSPVAHNDTRLRRLRMGDREYPYYTRTDRRDLDVSIATYMYIHRGEPVANVFSSLLASSFTLLVGETGPVTLLMVDAGARLSDEAALLARTERLLAAIWDFYRRVCVEEPAA